MITLRNVSKKFRLFPSPRERIKEALDPFGRRYHESFWALREIDMAVGRGETVGILGRNGSGKTTLLEIVSSVLLPTSGQVSVQGHVSALLALGTGFDPEFSGRQNVLLNGAIHGLSQKEMERRLPAIEAFADIGVHFDQKMKTYSSGMYLRVAFAAAINVDPEILVIDEALAVGDAGFQFKCFNRLRQIKKSGATILLVSHDVRMVAALCERVLVLEGGRMIFDGEVREGINRYDHLLFGAPPSAAPDAPNESGDDPASSEPPVVPGATGAQEAREAFFRDFQTREPISRHPNFNPHHYRIHDGRATLLDYLMISDHQVNPVRLSRNRQVDLFVKWLIRDTIHCPNIGMAVNTLAGTLVYGTNTILQQESTLTAPLATGQVVISHFSLELRLNNGHYLLNLGIDDQTGDGPLFVDVRRGLIHLEVIGPGDITGLADFDGTVRCFVGDGVSPPHSGEQP